MPHIIHYLLTNKACDLREVNSFRSMQSYTYLKSGWVARVLLHELDERRVLLKCQVQASQSLKTHHDAWVCCQRSGEVENSGCTCMAGRGKVCSHVGALLWKVDMAVSQGLTGEACTDTSATWNRGTKRDLEPAALTDINLKVQLRTIDNDTTKKAIPFLPQLLGDDADVDNFYRNCPFKEIVNAPGEKSASLSHLLTRFVIREKLTSSLVSALDKLKMTAGITRCFACLLQCS